MWAKEKLHRNKSKRIRGKCNAMTGFFNTRSGHNNNNNNNAQKTDCGCVVTTYIKLILFLLPLSAHGQIMVCLCGGWRVVQFSKTFDAQILFHPPTLLESS